MFNSELGGRAEKESHFESSELKSSCFIGNKWVGQKNKRV